MKTINLTKNKVALVDDSDYLELSKYKWTASNSGNNMYYATRSHNGKQVYLHRELMSSPKGMSIDHINHNTLDNQRSNLRICTHAENLKNQKPHKDKLGKYSGVDFIKNRNKYRARITVDYKEIHLGVFDTEKEAYKVRVKAEEEYFGDFQNVQDQAFDTQQAELQKYYGRPE